MLQAVVYSPKIENVKTTLQRTVEWEHANQEQIEDRSGE